MDCLENRLSEPIMGSILFIRIGRLRPSELVAFDWPQMYTVRNSIFLSLKLRCPV